MKAFLARSPLGVFAFSEDGQLLAARSAKSIDEALSFLKNAENPLSEELSGYEIVENESSYRIFRRNFRQIANDIFKDSGSINGFLNEFGIKYSMSLLSTAVTRDKLLIQASNALEDLTKITNIYAERLWEWFSLHYPEAKRKDVVENVSAFGNRKNFPSFSSSLGIDLKESDEKMLKSYASMVKDSLEKKKKLEKYVQETSKEIMPNVSSLIDPMLAARFLALAGSLERLARMPASTIQLLGAEKSLFRHLKQQGKSPKFGLLFQDGRIQSAPNEKRGKVARIISSKLMLAARIDFYSQRAEPKLKIDLEKEMARL
jgi:nucleolar protein 56